LYPPHICGSTSPLPLSKNFLTSFLSIKT
jgi:hypothetical protein